MKPVSLEQLEPVWDALSARTGIRRAGARLDAQNPVCGQLLSRLRAVGITQLLNDLDHESPLLDEVLDELTVRETYFFRDASQFEFIRSQILPEVLTRRGQEHVMPWQARSLFALPGAFAALVVIVALAVAGFILWALIAD